MVLGATITATKKIKGRHDPQLTKGEKEKWQKK
jgi:hypothetical protein